MATNILIRLAPLRPEPGEEVKIAIVARHPMEPGTRRDMSGNIILADFLKTFEVSFEGELVASVTAQGGLSANPLLSFKMTPDKPGKVLVRATDLNGEVTEATARLEFS